MRKYVQLIREEIQRAIPAVVYFIIAFNLINFTESLQFRSDQIPIFSYLEVTLGALVAGKMLILIDLLPFINAFPNKPMAYNIAWKFCIYNIGTLLFRIVEGYLELWLHYRNADLAWYFLKIKLASPEFWAIQMWLVLILFVYVVFNEFIRVLGRKKVARMLFGK